MLFVFGCLKAREGWNRLRCRSGIHDSFQQPTASHYTGDETDGKGRPVAHKNGVRRQHQTKRGQNSKHRIKKHPSAGRLTRDRDLNLAANRSPESRRPAACKKSLQGFFGFRRCEQRNGNQDKKTYATILQSSRKKCWVGSKRFLVH